MEERLFHDVTAAGLELEGEGCLLRILLRDCLIVIRVHSDINYHLSPVSQYMLVPGTFCSLDLIKHVIPHSWQHSHTSIYDYSPNPFLPYEIL